MVYIKYISLRALQDEFYITEVMVEWSWFYMQIVGGYSVGKQIIRKDITAL